MKVPPKLGFDGLEICGADIPKCDGTYSAAATSALGAAQRGICTVAKINWNELFGSPPIQMTLDRLNGHARRDASYHGKVE